MDNEFKLNDKVIISNIEGSQDSYRKYLNETGIVKMIDNITFSGEIIYFVSFFNDIGLHLTEYLNSMDSNIIEHKPKYIPFYKENLNHIIN